MSHYFKKQITIVLIFVLILAIIGAAVYFLTRPSGPTCSDGIKNQGEEDVDCGGPCKKCKEIEDLKVISKKFIPTTENNFDLVAVVGNPNIDWGARLASYVFELYDGASQLIGSVKGTTYFLPQETKYIVEQRFYSEKTIVEARLMLSDVSWEKLSQINDLELKVKNTDYQILEDGSSEFIGVMENKSSYDLDKIEIVGILFDNNGEIAAAGKTFLNTVMRNENREFSFFWPYPIAVQIKSFIAKTYTNVFLNDNFIKIHGEPKDFEE
ncbi:MAG: hypothetical protein OEV37_04185 [Candidatus Berkelbacteria bacterium]|nr:hypothetical protein [Candidatus Berkelbacteria bacterium]